MYCSAEAGNGTSGRIAPGPERMTPPQGAPSENRRQPWQRVEGAVSAAETCCPPGQRGNGILPDVPHVVNIAEKDGRQKGTLFVKTPPCLTDISESGSPCVNTPWYPRYPWRTSIVDARVPKRCVLMFGGLYKCVS